MRPAALAMLLALLAGLNSIGCGEDRKVEQAERILVVASISPLADFARRVGGDRVQVEVLVSPGESPHTFEPKSAQMKSVAQASVLVLNGVGLEYWADDVIKALNNPGLVVVKTAEDLEIIQGNASSDKHHHESGNPHVWLDPLYAVRQVENIRDALIEADPEGKGVYQAGADDYVEQLRALDADIRITVATFSSKKFIAQHAGWDYFARRYGLVQAGVVETTPGREPSPAEIAEIVQTIRAAKAKAIFAEAQLSKKVAEVIAAESGAQVLHLNPLGVPPAFDYLETMRYNLAQLEKGLK
ncbi:MAG: zinc ABC transporter solute-binding protein [Armatimonadetes bacterium]|nr:zinc ABC transporter solute-binding protein [Armatimonadota bacterium]NIN05236.1 zinc ABC transporter solute-binding protein [Armatimonadota bacterium]NIO76748.1 zinc ABC transporter solute-binding protein [Armatimonadota bacterium]